jgi:tight adherence protein B
MSGHGMLWALLLLSCITLLGFGVSAVLVSRSQKIRAKRNARLAAVASPRTRSLEVEISAFTKPKEAKNRSAAAMAAGLFGFDVNKLEQYPLRWWVILLITLVIAKVGQSLAGGIVGNLSYAAIPVAWVMLSRNVFSWAESRRHQKLLNQFPDALAMIVRSVRVGIPVMEAMRNVARDVPAPTGPEFLRLVEQVSIGVSVEDAVMEQAVRADIPEYRFFATTICLQNQTGGTLSESLDNLADMIRKRIALVGKANALASEAKTCAVVLAALPVLTAVALWALTPSYFALLFNDPQGRSLFGSAVVSLFMGLGTIRLMIRKTLA